MRLFITHTHAHREVAGSLKLALLRYGIDAFVAHDDIAPTHAWEDEIIRALGECNALIALLSDDARASAWVDQECGWAMARDIPIISVDIGSVPYGFLGRYQALPGRGRSAFELAREVYDILLANGSTYWTLVEAVVAGFENSDNYADANLRFRLLEQLPTQGLTEEHLSRLEAAQASNSQVRDAFNVQDGLAALLARHRAAWEAFREEERQAQEELGGGF